MAGGGGRVEVEAISTDVDTGDAAEDLTALAERVLVLERMAVQAHERAQTLNKEGKFEGVWTSWFRRLAT